MLEEEKKADQTPTKIAEPLLGAAATEEQQTA
jgi:hypothetical protein